MTRRARLLSAFDRRARRRDEHGYVLALTALVLLPLLLISAMAVDFGAWYTQGSRMQKAADAAALAGVVWLPDLTEATSVAKETAKANGYDDALSNVTVAVTKLSDNELKVVITDTAGKVYLAKWVKNSVTISRSATAKYVLPVPLGSPRNFFGTGPMYTSNPEYFYAAVNGTCQSKVQGDPFAVPYISTSTNACGTTNRTANSDYIDPGDSNQYEYYITVPPGRTQDILVSLWNPAGNETHTQTQTTTSTATNTETITSTGPTQPTNSCSGSASNYTCTTTITLSATAGSSNTPTTSCSTGWGGTYTCTTSFYTPSGWWGGTTTTQTITSTSGQPTALGACTSSGSGSTRTWTCKFTVTTTGPSLTTPGFSCTSSGWPSTYSCKLTTTYTQTSTSTTTSNVTDPGGGSGVPETTFSLYSADATPLDDSDNPLLSATECGTASYPNPHTYSSGYSGSTRTMLGKEGWDDFCVIPASAPSGKYILSLKNSSTDGATGLNGYAVMASYTNSIGTVCDSRTDTMCPKVAGKNWISIYANQTASVASFYLAEISGEYAGKTLLITLFDPGEGGNYIEILDPDGNPVSFVATDMGSNGATPSTPLASSTKLDVTQSRYNGHYVQLSIDLPGDYATAYSQYWWKIRYTFTSGSVTDRTTWGVRVLGNPVHLTS
jgi:Flp pilus assembly protein TadG